MKKNITSKGSFIVAFCLISFVYIVAFFILDDYLTFGVLYSISVENVAVILLLFLLSIFTRYFRWHILMKGHGIKHSFFLGLFFYIAGFAYTATPGKLGELSRIVHYRNVGVPSDVVISSFITERFFDLIVVLIMASAIFSAFPNLRLVAFLILLIVASVLLLTVNIRVSKLLFRNIVKVKCKNVSRLCCLLYKVLHNINKRLDLKTCFSSLTLGVIAWTCTSLILVYLCNLFSISLPFLDAYSVYPAAMLSGAVSFIPGGVGATEVVIVFLLSHFGAKIEVASIIALLVRFSTLWLAMFIGIFCTLISSIIVAKDLGDWRNLNS